MYNKSILITGGTGSFAHSFVENLLKIIKKLDDWSFLVGMNINSL